MKNKIFRYLKYFFILQICLVSFGIISSLVPNNSVKTNIEKSINKYRNEHIYPEYFIKNDAHRYDNFIDFLIISTIYNSSPHKPLKYFIFPTFTATRIDGHIATNALDFQINKEPEKYYLIEYPRYWHGNSFAYKLLFAIAELDGVRWINFFISTLLIITFTTTLGKSIPKIDLYLIIIGMIFANYYLIFTSMFFAPVFFVTFLGVIYMLKFLNQNRKLDVLFLTIGGLTAYFDLLTTPVISIGIPLLVLVAYQKEIVNWFSYLLKIIGYATLWFCGYLFTWVFKWILVLTFTDYPIIKDAFGSIGLRAGIWQRPRMEVIWINFERLNLNFFYIMLIIMVLLSIFYFNKKGINKAILFLCIAMMPLIWIFLTANHADVHCWFTYRNLWITVSGLLLMLASLIRWQDIKILKNFKSISK